MGKAKFIIDGQPFGTKLELQNKVRSILWGYLDGQSLELADFDFILDLLRNHPTAHTKIGNGVSRIYTRQNPIYKNTRSFYLERIDGSETDFSYLECISPTTKRKKVFMAFRVLIEPDMIAFKQKFFDNNGGEAICEFTNQKIRFIGSHVDHIPPNTFDAIFNGFANYYGLNIEAVELKDELADNKIQNELADAQLANEWIKWHRERAKLRVVSRLANLSHVKKQG